MIEHCENTRSIDNMCPLFTKNMLNVDNMLNQNCYSCYIEPLLFILELPYILFCDYAYILEAEIIRFEPLNDYFTFKCCE